MTVTMDNQNETTIADLGYIKLYAKYLKEKFNEDNVAVAYLNQIINLADSVYNRLDKSGGEIG